VDKDDRERHPKAAVEHQDSAKILPSSSLLYLHINRSCFISFSTENLEE
jgi:hypothetical protein